MTRPNIIRADTIDLQSQDSPSAKDHTRQPAHPAPLGGGPPAPHQAVTLRHAEQEASDLHLRSPRVSQDLSGKELQLLHDVDEGESYNAQDGEEPFGLGRNGAAEGEPGDAEADESMDDDMMDKISSSPSIDDGGCHLPLPWPDRGDSLVSFHTAEEDVPPAPPEHDRSSSPFLVTPTHYPLFYSKDEGIPESSKDRNLQSGYPHTRSDLLGPEDDFESESRDRLSPLPSERAMGSFQEDFHDVDDSYDGDFDPEDFRHLLLPADDPLLDNSFDDEQLSPSEKSVLSHDPQLPMDHAFPEEPGEADEDTENVSFSDDDRFVDSGWGGECLREAEDIDFEFVYALHTFVATVEGQANATKGDTMVLLDDSNSYWWLVRVVKDSSIGYLPAEHIETPTERLARLNKHRNIDLSQTMLGDNPEKSKNPLKKAMRRRNAKTVQFTAPTYVEASEVEYSSEEEEENEGDYFGQGHNEEGPDGQGQDQEQVTDESATIEPLNSSGQPIINPQAAIDPRVDAPTQSDGVDRSRPSEEANEQPDDGAFAKSRKGTVRNTDSFFKDDNVETRKINLTPSLLRDDSSSTINTVRSVEPREPLKTRPSLDSLEKSTSPQDKAKEERRRKEKKGMLGGLFKRKDRKGKAQDDTDDNEKLSDELLRGSPQGKGSSESLPLEQQPAKSPPKPQRQTSKLQKAPPPGVAPRVMSPPGPRDVISPTGGKEVVSPKTNLAEQQSRLIPPPKRAPPSVAQISIPRAFEEPQGDLANRTRQAEEETPEPTREEPSQIESPKESRRGVFSPIKDVLLSSSPSTSEPKPEKVKKVKQRMPMDEFDSDSSPDIEEDPDPLLRQPEPIIQQEREGEHDVPEDAIKERLSESPVEVTTPESSYSQQQPFGLQTLKNGSPVQQQEPYSQPAPRDKGRSQQELSYAQEAPQGRAYNQPQQYDQTSPQNQTHSQRSPQDRALNQQQPSKARQSPLDRSYNLQQQFQKQQSSPTQPPPLVNDTSSAEDPSTSPTSPLSSPSLIEPPQEVDVPSSGREETPASTNQSSNAPTWSDASLRAYLEDDSDIRDLLLLVHDKSDIKPAPPDHPVAKGLFKEENRRLGEMGRELDGMLGRVLERRKKGRATLVR